MGTGAPRVICGVPQPVLASSTHVAEFARVCVSMNVWVPCSFGSTLLGFVWPECAEAAGVGPGILARTLTWSGLQG